MDHVAGVPILSAHAVHICFNTQVLRIRHFIGRQNPRPNRTKCVATFALSELASPLFLEITLRHIIHDCITSDIFQRVFFGHVFRLRPDHNPKLTLPVHRHRTTRHQKRIIRTAQRTCRFHKEHRLTRLLRTGFGDMHMVIKPNTHDLANARNRHPKSCIRINKRQGFGVQRPQLGQTDLIKGCPINVRHLFCQTTYPAFKVH